MQIAFTTISDTEHLILYIILVVPPLVYWKNQVRCTSVARAYLGLFSFLFLREGLLDLACLLACLLRYSRERASQSLFNFHIATPPRDLIFTQVPRPATMPRLKRPATPSDTEARPSSLPSFNPGLLEHASVLWLWIAICRSHPRFARKSTKGAALRDSLDSNYRHTS